MDITLSLTTAKAIRLFDALEYLYGPLPEGANKTEWAIEAIKTRLKIDVQRAERDIAQSEIVIEIDDELFS